MSTRLVSRCAPSLLALLLFLPAGAAEAFFCIQWSQGNCVYWASARATMSAFLGAPLRPLINGTITYDQNLILAANEWNTVGAIQFGVENGTVFNNPCGARDNRSHVCTNTGPAGDNPVFFSSSFCGQAFGDIIELTNNCWNSANGQMFNAPVFVNANVAWDAYDGNLRFVGTQPLYDIRRVLLHELGHVLGLDHPDENGQTVDAIMNSRIGNHDRLQDDDSGGARFIYASRPDQQGSLVGTGGCHLHPAPTAGMSAWTFVLAGLAAMARQRRRAVHSTGQPSSRRRTMRTNSSIDTRPLRSLSMHGSA